MTHKNDQQLIEHTHNTARFFTESRHIAWVLLIATLLGGAYGYWQMPQRKDPDVPIRIALVLVPWPGVDAEKIEQLVTRRVEQAVAENAKVETIESNTRTGLTAIYVTLVEGTKEVGKEFDDIKLKLDGVHNLPDGAGPIQFLKDFGDTAALMFTVASPKVDATEISLRARSLQQQIERLRMRAEAPGEGDATSRSASARVTLAHGLPTSIHPNSAHQAVDFFMRAAIADGVLTDARILELPGFIGVDAATDQDDAALAAYVERFLRERLRASEFHPDAWPAVLIRNPAETMDKLTRVAGSKYSYRELDDFTDLMVRSLKGLSVVSKIDRSGLLDERIFLEYSQERIASYGVTPTVLRQALEARNITVPGGTLEAGSKNLTIDPSGEFTTEKELENVLVTTTNGDGVYLRDLADVSRSYVSPPAFLNFYTGRGADGEWRRSRSVTVAVQMRAGQKIGEFGQAVDARLDEVSQQLPDDLVVARTSDQPRQVREQIDLFMSSLYEAIALVVLVSLVGFWEWRSALLMALSIPITLAMTFGMMFVIGIDLQQVSIASLIIALGLLVDDPVVAGDAIKRDLALGHPPVVAAWLGPTKLATAILFATITNIVAYVPFLTLSGDAGAFMYSLPVVVGCSLVASRLVSMTFIPLLGYYLLRPKAEPTIEERRKSGFAAAYYRFGRQAIEHRWAFLAASLAILIGAGFFASRLRSQYFPKDLSYLSYVDMWLPEDAPLAATRRVVEQVEAIVQREAAAYGKTHPDADGKPRDVLRSLTTFVGGGGPRFWFSISPEPSQLNYAQVVLEVFDKHDTAHLLEPVQRAVDAEVPGVRIDVRQLETASGFAQPVAVRISGEDMGTLRQLAARALAIFREIPIATRAHDNWGPETFEVRLTTNADRANLSGLTNRDVAAASSSAMNGATLTTLREGDRQIPIVARLRAEQRAALSDIRSLYVYSSQGSQKVPLEAISSIGYGMRTEKLQRRNQFRTVTVGAFPVPERLPSELLAAAMPRLQELQRSLPPGYYLEFGGEYEDQVKGFQELAIVMLMSVAMIFLALVIQFKHAIKPLIVFAAIPFGIAGALFTLWLVGSPFGFVAFLGVASLIGVIVSHIIVLFDFIEEAHEQGKPLEEALLDAGIVRLRPVLITVAATVTALFPLAAHGGPLWEPMCYAQIGGLTTATFVTLLLVPVIYATFSLDLKLVKWNVSDRSSPADLAPSQQPVLA